MNITPLYGQVRAADDAVVGEHCTFGFPKEARVRAEQREPGSQGGGESVVIGRRCLLANQVVLYEGVRIGDDCVIEDRVRVGDRCRLVYGAYVCDRVVIGTDARIAGFVCDGTVIGDGATVMGELVHEYTRPHMDWWEADEEAPVIEPDSVIGFGSRVIGGVTIGPRSYVAAGAIVTRDVPPEHVATGVNVHTPAREWTGKRLRSLIGHWTGRR